MKKAIILLLIHISISLSSHAIDPLVKVYGNKNDYKYINQQNREIGIKLGLRLGAKARITPQIIYDQLAEIQNPNLAYNNIDNQSYGGNNPIYIQNNYIEENMPIYENNNNNSNIIYQPQPIPTIAPIYYQSQNQNNIKEEIIEKKIEIKADNINFYNKEKQNILPRQIEMPYINNNEIINKIAGLNNLDNTIYQISPEPNSIISNAQILNNNTNNIKKKSKIKIIK